MIDDRAISDPINLTRFSYGMDFLYLSTSIWRAAVEKFGEVDRPQIETKFRQLLPPAFQSQGFRHWK